MAEGPIFRLCALVSAARKSRTPLPRPLAKIALDVLLCGRKRGIDIDPQWARRRLNALHPDAGSSAIGANHICQPDCDLQIIMPVHNVERQLDGCIQSVLRQETSYTWRLTIIDDGSTDGSWDIITRYADDPRISVLRQGRKGLGSARNAGLAQITGRYVMFIDSDDALADGAVQCLMEMACADDADVVEGNIFNVRRGRERLCRRHEREERLTAAMRFPQSWAKVFRAELWRGIRFPEKYWFEDVVFPLVILPMAARVSATVRPVYKYFRNPNGICALSRGHLKSLDILYVTEAMLRDCAALGTLGSYGQRLYEYLFLQVRAIFSRTMALGEEVRQCVFAVVCEVMESRFPGFHTATPGNKALEAALRNHDYKAYLLDCLLS